MARASGWVRRPGATAGSVVLGGPGSSAAGCPATGESETAAGTPAAPVAPAVPTDPLVAGAALPLADDLASIPGSKAGGPALPAAVRGTVRATPNSPATPPGWFTPPV